MYAAADGQYGDCERAVNGDAVPFPFLVPWRLRQLLPMRGGGARRPRAHALSSDAGIRRKAGRQRRGGRDRELLLQRAAGRGFSAAGVPNLRRAGPDRDAHVPHEVSA